jgi:DMSO reductase anchor subunit
MTYKLLFDFGIVVLIWITQLIVYPSFTQFDPADLQRWHSTYTIRISIIVMPLMIGQLGFHIYYLMQDASPLPIIALVFIILAWVNTFLFAVPLHNLIGVGQEIAQTAQRLVSVNAWRTGFWSIVFFIDLYLILKK